jgi:hypothetical protein
MIRATILAPVLVLDEAANQQPIPVAAGASALRAASAAWAQASFCDEAMPRATTSLPSMTSQYQPGPFSMIRIQWNGASVSSMQAGAQPATHSERGVPSRIERGARVSFRHGGTLPPNALALERLRGCRIDSKAPVHPLSNCMIRCPGEP